MLLTEKAEALREEAECLLIDSAEGNSLPVQQAVAGGSVSDQIDSTSHNTC